MSRERAAVWATQPSSFFPTLASSSELNPASAARPPSTSCCFELFSSPPCLCPAGSDSRPPLPPSPSVRPSVRPPPFQPHGVLVTDLIYPESVLPSASERARELHPDPSRRDRDQPVDPRRTTSVSGTNQDQRQIYYKSAKEAAAASEEKEGGSERPRRAARLPDVAVTSPISSSTSPSWRRNKIEIEGGTIPKSPFKSFHCFFF